ncbi:MAG: pitrilysin family protein [Candidatus Saccharibacteria bacterium]|nr:pitrilysin family protein [Candidatus Saccharibacteria bacterium]
MKHTVKEVVLKNGARGLFIDIPDATVMQYKFHFRAGNRQVKTPEIYETAHLMEHMSFGANAKFDCEQDYAAEFSKNGARNNAYTSDNSMVYLGVCADFEWERVLKLQQLAICQPRFSQSKLEAEQGNVRNELTGMLSSHSNLLWYKMQQILGDNILDLQQRLETINNIKLEDIVEHHTRTHTIENMRFLVAGRLANRERKLKQILESFRLPKGELLPIPKDEPHSHRAVLIKQQDGKSITFGISLILDRRLTKREAYVMMALNHILTGTTYSRIFGKAREKGLVYSMFSDYEQRYYDCSWDFAGQVMPETAEALFDLMIYELQQIAAGKIFKKEIDETKSYQLGSFQISTQTISQLVNFYTGTYFERDEIRSYATVPNYISKVSKAEIVALIKEFMTNGHWALVGVGNVDQELIEKLNTKLQTVFKGGDVTN